MIWAQRILLITFALLVVLAALAVGCRQLPDQCDPRSFRSACAGRQSFTACRWVDSSDYLLGAGDPHFEVASVTCSGGTLICVSGAGGARGVAK